MSRVPIDPQDWAALDRLLDAALDLSVAERERWLASLGPEYARLKPQLRDLLSRAAEVETRDFLNTLPRLEDDGAGQSVAADQAGQCVGPYRLLRELGTGGMASVWLAERLDGLMRRPVALKLPHLATARVGLAERMARERDILASLAHPHIARLYDAGVTAEGRPYLALEYVVGQPIDAYCAERQLGLRARLQLFLQVASAVAYAHANLVIHRDLKPANILVTSEGEVRLLDFGVAKLLEAGQARSTQLTEVSGHALTLDYASPEQILGEPLTIATDVYSLGVVLYELLTANRPYRPERGSRGALEDAIVQEDAMRMSDVAGPSLGRALRGDLDTIVLKALKKHPADRYGTVNAFADDVLRYLQLRPVLAQPDSVWYRARRFVARNRMAVGASAAVLLALLAGAAIALWQARIAVLQQQRAEEVKSFIASILRDTNLDADESRPASVLDLLKQAADRASKLQAQPAVRVELLNLLGLSLLSRGDTDTMERVVKQAVSEGTRSLGGDHPLTLRARALMAWVHMYRGRTDEMRVEVDDVMRLMERDPATFAADLVELWRMRADQAIDAADYVEAEAAAKEALSRAEAAFGPRHSATLEALQVLATAYGRNGKLAEALRTAERAKTLALGLFVTNPSHPLALNARAGYARALAGVGRMDEAVDQMTEALADATKVFGPNSRSVGFDLQLLASYQLKLGMIEAAMDSSARAFDIVARHAQPGSFSHAASLNVRGLSLLAARHGREALPIVAETEAAASHIFGPVHPNALIARANRALALAYSGRLDEAGAMIETVMQEARRSKASVARPFYVASVIARLGGKHSASLDLAKQALALIDDQDAEKVELAQLRTQIGLALLELGVADALMPLQQARAAFTESERQITPWHADALIGLGRVYLAAGRAGDALPLLERADEYWRRFDSESRWAGEAALWRGRAYLATGRGKEAGAVLRRAQGLLSRSPIPSDRELAKLASRSP